MATEAGEAGQLGGDEEWSLRLALRSTKSKMNVQKTREDEDSRQADADVGVVVGTNVAVVQADEQETRQKQDRKRNGVCGEEVMVGERRVSWRKQRRTMMNATCDQPENASDAVPLTRRPPGRPPHQGWRPLRQLSLRAVCWPGLILLRRRRNKK